MNRDVAIVGMVCKTPGADNIEQFWDMLCQGKEGLRALSADEKERCQIKTKEQVVYAGGFLTGVDQFDPELFGYTARDAAYMDPQHRLFLQACWEALEISGNAGDAIRAVGVFASASYNSYLTNVILKQGIEEQQYQSALIGNASDCLATRVSYCLNLTGPSMTIQCGCSSSLVAVHQARLALLAKQCDAALVGGISIAIPHYQGYNYLEGGFASADGHCRPFSMDAGGTVFASGYGVVVLKRLDDAIKDGDLIYAVLKGSATNNDGSDKASFTAPSVHGQSEVIAKALRVANIELQTIQYIEAHGTGTPIGDPIELAALQNVVQLSSCSPNWQCTLGSVKANVGHLDIAAGIVGLIKTSLMLYFKIFTPQLHFKGWNARILGGALPFQINSTIQGWNVPDNTKRRAGISAFGFGGSNAHLILEESTDQPVTKDAEGPSKASLIVLSAKTVKRLLIWADSLREFLLMEPSVSLSELAYTLQVGRKQWHCRYCFSVNSIEELIKKLGEITELDIAVCQQIRPLAQFAHLTQEAIQQEWMTGARIEWSTLYPQKMKKCVLPAAPLLLDSYWLESIEASEKEKNPLVKHTGEYDKWLYQNVWHEVMVPAESDIHSLQPLLILTDNVNTSLQAFLEHCKRAGITYSLMERNEDLAALEKQWERHGFKPKTLLHWVSAPTKWEDTVTSVMQSLAIVNGSSIIRSISTLAYVVSGMSDLFYQSNHPGLSLYLAFNRGIRQELPYLETKLIDIDPHASFNHQHEQVTNSLNCTTLQDFCVWRDKKCWQVGYQTLSNPKIKAQQNNVEHAYFKKGGIYLITGGLGNVASVHVEFLASDYQATLVLVGRTPIPPEESWSEYLKDLNTPNELRTKIQQLMNWKNKGFSIVTHTADVTSFDEFQRICQTIKETLGQIDGIVHIAGVGSDMHYKPLSDVTQDHCEQLFIPKLRGMQSIDRVMNQFNIPECLVISSISAVLAGIGLAVYAGVHNLLDAYVKKEYPHWRIMNWDAWNFHQKSTVDPALGALGAGMDKLSISPEEGLMVLREAFHRPYWQQLYISTTDLPARVQRWVNRQDVKQSNKTKKRAPRPLLRSEFIMSSTPVQQQLAELWASLIGVEPIGIHDSFFELGGDSLLALELIQRLQTNFSYSCTIMDLFEAATIAKLAQKINQNGVGHKEGFSAIRARAALRKAALADNSR